jgi:hypothetical protein
MYRHKNALRATVGICVLALGIGAIKPTPVAAQFEELGEFAGRVLFEFLVRAGTQVAVEAWRGSGTSDVKDLRAKLEICAQHDQEHAQLLRDLQRQLDDRMTSTQVRALVNDALTKIDSRLAKLAERIDQQQKELDSYGNQLGLTAAEMGKLKASIGRVEVRVTIVEHKVQDVEHNVREVEQKVQDVEHQVAEIAETHPRSTFAQQSAALGAAGMDALLRGDLTESQRAFRLGIATSPIDAGHHYGLALALHGLGRQSDAEAALAQAVVVERRNGRPGQWYFVSMERVQGGGRNWLEQARCDPAYGAYTAGDLGQWVPSSDARRVRSRRSVPNSMDVFTGRLRSVQRFDSRKRLADAVDRIERLAAQHIVAD